MKCKVKNEFIDAKDGTLHQVGDVIEVTEARFKEINGAGYGVLVEKVAAKRAAKKED